MVMFHGVDAGFEGLHTCIDSRCNPVDQLLASGGNGSPGNSAGTCNRALRHL